MSFERYRAGQGTEGSIDFSKEKKHKKKIIVEIGASHTPVFSEFKDLAASESADESFYIGLDRQKGDTRLLKNTLKKEWVNGEAVISDAQDLPFADRSVDEVIFSNILNSNIILKSQKRKASLDLNRQKNTVKKQAEWLAETKRIFEEGLRILKLNGKILITEYDFGGKEYAGNPQVYDEVMEFVRSCKLEGKSPVISQKYAHAHRDGSQLNVLEINYPNTRRK